MNYKSQPLTHHTKIHTMIYFIQLQPLNVILNYVYLSDCLIYGVDLNDRQPCVLKKI